MRARLRVERGVCGAVVVGGGQGVRAREMRGEGEEKGEERGRRAEEPEGEERREGKEGREREKKLPCKSKVRTRAKTSLTYFTIFPSPKVVSHHFALAQKWIHTILGVPNLLYPLP